MTPNKIVARLELKNGCRYRERYPTLVGGLLVLSLVIFSVGCASIPYKPIPTSPERTVVRVLEEGPSKMNDLPGGQYKIPEIHVYIIRRPSPGSQQASMMFGLLGLLAATYAEQEDSKAAVNEIEEAFRIDIALETRRAFDEALKQGKTPSNWTMDSGEKGLNQFEVIPYIILIVEGDQFARPFLFMKVRLVSQTKGETWATRYVYYVRERRAVVGPNSWTENQGEAFKKATLDALRNILNVLFSDTKTERTRNVVPGKLKGKFMGALKPYEQKGEILEETEDTIVFNILSQGVINGGINIIPKNEVEKFVPD